MPESNPSGDTAAEQQNTGVIGGVVALGEKAAQFVTDAWRKLNNLAETNYQLGCIHVENGNYKDAVMRFRMALWLNQNHYPSHYNLGCCYVTLGRNDEARACFKKALAIWPQYDEARFMLAMVDSREKVATMPEALVLNHFGAVAEVYDAENVEEFGYQGHTLVHQAAMAHIPADATGFSVLDLGCGTGLVGALFRTRAARIVGVDISPEMLAKARARTMEGISVYDELKESEIVAWLTKDMQTTFDVVTAAHVLPYIGDLGAVFAGVAKALPRGGLFVFTAEAMKQDAYALLPGLGRFGHNPEYLASAAQRAGLALVSLETVQLFKDYPAQLGVCRRQ